MLAVTATWADYFAIGPAQSNRKSQCAVRVGKEYDGFLQGFGEFGFLFHVPIVHQLPLCVK